RVPARVDAKPVALEELAERRRLLAWNGTVQQRLPHRPPLAGRDRRCAGNGEHPGLLEQLARGRDDAGSLRGAERFATVHGHAGVLDVHAPARTSVEAAGKLQLV